MINPAYVYRVSVDPDSDTAQASVMRFVGKNREVIDLGAGPGSLSQPLIDVNACNVSAVEINGDCVEILRGFCKDVWQRDLNSSEWNQGIPSGAFDAVVLADVLEHLYDPWKFLESAKTLINDTGAIIISLPHASHASILACLINDDFRYSDWGLLDRTHIRFFGMKNIQSLVEGAGLVITGFDFILQHPKNTEFSDVWSALSSGIRANIEALEYSNVYQVVLRAEPMSRPGTVPLQLVSERPVRSLSQLRFIAFYLPQFHPIPENDEWWGKGFTEWTNVTKASPLYAGHYQPHLPTELGFYDLRIPEVRHEQISLARAHGIDAFCFHYYWFGGRRLLERPVFDFLADAKAEIDFCLCWANENWTRAWDASEKEVLMEQVYTKENDLEFIKSIEPFFRDRRYLRVGTMPMLIVYRPQHMPDAHATTLVWRQYCRDVGIGEIHLVAALTHTNEEFRSFGFDAGLEFPPHNILIDPQGTVRNYAAELNASGAPATIMDYHEVAKYILSKDYSEKCVYRGVVPSWDNTARRPAGAHVLKDATPELYEHWLEKASNLTISEREPQQRLVFINAWNEWAEGCHLEPDRKYGREFLEATKRVKAGRSRASSESWTARSPTAQPNQQSETDSQTIANRRRRVVVRHLSRFPIVHRAARKVVRTIIRWWYAK